MVSLDEEKAERKPFVGRPTSRAGLLPRMNTSIAVFLGILIGLCIQSQLSKLYSSTPSISPQSFSSFTQKEPPANIKGIITTLADTPFRPTSHVDTLGRPIEKQQFVEPFVIPNFVGYSVATFKPGQTMMPPHEHESLHEFFYVLEGSGIFQVNGIDHKVEKGWFLHMAPHDKHGIFVPEDSPDGDLKMAVCGVTVD